MGNQNSNPFAAAAEASAEVQKAKAVISPQTTFNNATTAYTNARNKLWNARVSLEAHNADSTENEWKKKWATTTIQNIVNQWQTIINGWSNELRYIREYNLFIEKNIQQITNELNKINEEILLAKVKSESNENKVSTIDRNSFLHLEDYKNRLNIFHKCKKIILFFIICIILLTLLSTAVNKMG